jgi:hypothetical protein
MQGRGNRTSIRPFLAAIRAMHTRAGFPYSTDDPVNADLRTGYTRATADLVASRPSSVALTVALGDLALTRAVRSRRRTIDAAIIVGFLFALRPMSIRGLQSDDLSFSTTIAFIRLRREKGNRGDRRDRVLRYPLATTPDAGSKLLTCFPNARLAHRSSPSPPLYLTDISCSSAARVASPLHRWAASPLGPFLVVASRLRTL